ncbi:hypothetical protein BDW59DRAFT_160791 [Aspergillus cavernicola]|uniref:Uncharacterized protein n=1 Tax=Aspergillus cavernicola TaxID=176166 RepID=A0ABR4IFQ5_9EURO
MPPSPPTATTTSPSDQDLESSILTQLATTHALEDLHATLLSSLQRHGWTEKIRRLSVDLLRANRCERFDEVVEAVVASAQGRRHPVLDSDVYNNSNSNNNNSHNGEMMNGGNGGDGISFQDVDVRIPKAVVDQGVRAIKEVLREVATLEEEDGERDGHRGSGGGEIAVETSTGGKRQGGKMVNGDATPAKKEKKTKQGKQGK